jgi:hypothetical protein
MKIILIIPYVLCFPGVVDAVDTADKHLRGSNRDLQFTGQFQFPAVDFSLATPTPTNPTQQAPPFQFSGPPGVFPGGGGGFPGGGGGLFGPIQPGDDNNDPGFPFPNVDFVFGPFRPPTGSGLDLGLFNPQPGSGGDDLGAKSCPNLGNADANIVCYKATEVPEVSSQGFGFAASASSASSPVNVNVNDCNGGGSFTRGAGEAKEICCC